MGDHVEKSKQLADFVRQLGDDFTIYDNIGRNYNHIDAAIADAILQANRDYEKIVRPRVNAIRVRYAKHTTTTDLLKL